MERAIEVAVRCEDLPVYRVWPLLGLARRAYTRFEAAERFRALGALGRELGHREIETRAGLGLVDTLLAAGDLDEAKGVLDVLDPHLLNHPEHQAGVLIRRARLARLSGFAEAEGQSLLAAAGQLLPPEGVPADRVLWFVESAFAALRDEDPARAAASLAELERRTAEVGLMISAPERRHLDQLPELHA